MSLSELAELREQQQSTHRERNGDGEEEGDSDSDSEGESDPYVGMSALQRQRELDLDRQYAEDNDKMWAAVPQCELMDDDRVAPFLRELLNAASAQLALTNES